MWLLGITAPQAACVKRRAICFEQCNFTVLEHLANLRGLVRSRGSQRAVFPSPCRRRPLDCLWRCAQDTWNEWLSWGPHRLLGGTTVGYMFPNLKIITSLFFPLYSGPCERAYDSHTGISLRRAPEREESAVPCRQRNWCCLEKHHQYGSRHLYRWGVL